MINFKKIIGEHVKFNKYFIMFTFILFILVTGSTYAYYAFQYENDSVITGNVIAINVELDVERVVGTNTKMVPLQDAALANALIGKNSSNGACIDNVGNLSCQVYKITLTNLGSRIQHVNGTVELYPKAGTGNAYSNLKWRELSNTTTIKTGSVINGMRKSTLVSDLTMESKEEKVWYIAVWLSEVESDQRETDKGIFEGTVTFDVESSRIKATDYVINLYNDGSAIKTINIAGDTTNPQVSLNETQKIMLDNNSNYRYYGSNPDNYVLYNDELWRIVSIGNVKANENDTIGETRVKIIKADYLTSKSTVTNTATQFFWDKNTDSSYDVYGMNDWSRADLMTLLNFSYYNSTSGACYTGAGNSDICDFKDTGLSKESQSLISDALYYLGGIDSTTNFYAHNFYVSERETDVYDCSDDDGACPRAIIWTGTIGVMYPSDYLFSTDLSVCKVSAGNYLNDSNCTDNIWMPNTWTITPSINAGAFVATPAWFDGVSVFAPDFVFPVLYLNANVVITSGEGTDEKPYVLSLGV